MTDSALASCPVSVGASDEGGDEVVGEEEGALGRDASARQKILNIRWPQFLDAPFLVPAYLSLYSSRSIASFQCLQ